MGKIYLFIFPPKGFEAAFQNIIPPSSSRVHKKHFKTNLNNIEGNKTKRAIYTMSAVYLTTNPYVSLKVTNNKQEAAETLI